MTNQCFTFASSCCSPQTFARACCSRQTVYSCSLLVWGTSTTHHTHKSFLYWHNIKCSLTFSTSYPWNILCCCNFALHFHTHSCLQMQTDVVQRANFEHPLCWPPLLPSLYSSQLSTTSPVHIHAATTSTTYLCSTSRCDSFHNASFHSLHKPWL